MEKYFTEYTERVEAACRRNLADWPLVREELAAVLPVLPAEEALCLQALYAGLGPQDLAGQPVERLLSEARCALAALEDRSWAIPQELFFTYVLPPRVNNEWPDGARPWLRQELAEIVKGKSFTDTALEVNRWCRSWAVYALSDDRTIAPLGMCRRTRGRCGEESTLLTAALRSVGVPARQVYAPRWSHCDDNHAWVEFFDGHTWRYMGACEPEESPDVGWFTAAASRAMLVRALAPDWERGGCRVVNVTDRYAPTACLTVTYTRDGRPAPGVPVRFQVVNDSRLCTIYEAPTDANGQTSLTCGLGGLTVSAWWDSRLAERQLDTRRERSVTLRWEEGAAPARHEGERVWEQVPPEEQMPPPPPEPSPAHRKALADCEAALARRREGFPKDGSRWLALAAGNYREIEDFLALPQFTAEDKEAVLTTLTEKDFADVTAETLADVLTAALPWKGRYQRLVWVNWVLAPRVEHEPLLPIRCELMGRLAGEGLRTGEDVLAWMRRNIKPVKDHGLTDRRGDAAGYVRHGVCPEAEWDLLAAQLCRAVGIPAFVSPDGGQLMLMAEGGAYAPGSRREAFRLRLTAPEGSMTYGEHFSLAQWTGSGYRTLALAHTVADHWDLFLTPGAYRLTTARRQVDGSLSVRQRDLILDGDRTAALTLGPDRTGEKLLHTALPPVMAFPFIEGDGEDLTAPTAAGSLVILAQPGAEPTEHLLRELLELAEAYRQGGWPVTVLVSRREEAENATLRQVLEALPGARCRLFRGDAYPLRQALGVGDARLPLAVVLDRQGRGVYACANYNIRTAHTIWKILTGIHPFSPQNIENRKN